MTNLVGIITVAFVTNWTTVSKTIPVGPQKTNPYTLEYSYLPTTLNQSGTVERYSFFETTWNGEPKKFLLGSEVVTNGLTRSVVEAPIGGINGNPFFEHALPHWQNGYNVTNPCIIQIN